MKKMFLALLALPMFLVACAEEKFDRNLNGTWEGTAQTSDLTQLQNLNSGVGSAAVQETIVFKFEDGNLTTYTARSQNQGQVEIEKGSYEKDDNRILFKLSQHSCVDAETGKDPLKEQTPLSRAMTYKISQDQQQVTVKMRVGKTVTLTRLTDDDAKDTEFMINQAVTGCFIPGKPFKQGKVKNPPTATAETAETSTDQIIEDAYGELGEVTPSEQ